MSGQCPLRITVVGGKQTITWHNDRLVGFGIILNGLTGYKNKFRNFIGIDRKSNRIYRSCPSINDDKLCWRRTSRDSLSSALFSQLMKTFTFHLIAAPTPTAEESLSCPWISFFAAYSLSRQSFLWSIVSLPYPSVDTGENAVIYKENPRNWVKDQTLLRHKITGYPRADPLICNFLLPLTNYITCRGKTLRNLGRRQVMMMCPCPSLGHVISLFEHHHHLTVVHSNL